VGGLDDPVFDVAITPNRQDCMGVYGIARDLAAAGVGTLRPVQAEPVRGAFACPGAGGDRRSGGCPASSAAWCAVFATGLRRNGCSGCCARRGCGPISALVDVTNYLTIGYGRPLHVYDVAKLQGRAWWRGARAAARRWRR
jgi:phenylalanyl-tRNA synthetase beta chain